MNTKIVLSTAIAILLSTTSLLAEAKCGDMPEKGMYKKEMKMKEHKQHRGPEFVHMIMKLDLSNEQRAEIRDIMRANMQNRQTSSSAFTENDFDKEKFIATEKERRSTGIEKKAQMIADIYAVLTPQQKKDFKTMLDMQEIMKKHKNQKSFQ